MDSWKLLLLHLMGNLHHHCVYCMLHVLVVNYIIILNTYSVYQDVGGDNFINLLNFIFLNFALGLEHEQMIEQEKRKIP